MTIQPGEGPHPVCEKCGDEIYGGASIWCCRYATECAMWPTSDGSPEGDGAELLMAKLWMGNALDQIGLQIAERDRLSSALAGLADCINTELRENGPHDDQISGIDVDMRPFVRRLVDRVRARSERCAEGEEFGK